VSVVIGQMLSGQAAETIYRRARAAAERRHLSGTWLVPDAALRSCGLSGRKVRTIREFRRSYLNNSEAIDQWQYLETANLFQTVESFWGMSHWTASMLAIFHFGQEDVYPHADGSLARALSRAEAVGIWNRRRDGEFQPDRAAPYRTYLALYLWRALDAGILARTTASIR
jgi:DNA-3-methyladenine glycosylase II